MLLNLGFNPDLRLNIEDPIIKFYVFPSIEENQIGHGGLKKLTTVNMQANGEFFYDVPVFEFRHPEGSGPFIKIFCFVNYDLYIEMAKPNSKFEISDSDLAEILGA